MVGIDVRLDRLLAANPASSETILLRLAGSTDKRTLSIIADRKTLSGEVMRAIYDHTDSKKILTRLVTHPEVPVSIFANLGGQFPTLFYRNKGMTWETLVSSGIIARGFQDEFSV